MEINFLYSWILHISFSVKYLSNYSLNNSKTRDFETRLDFEKSVHRPEKNILFSRKYWKYWTFLGRILIFDQVGLFTPGCVESEFYSLFQLSIKFDENILNINDPKDVRVIKNTIPKRKCLYKSLNLLIF